jgi:hypothetical protein
MFVAMATGLKGGRRAPFARQNDNGGAIAGAAVAFKLEKSVCGLEIDGR